MRSTAKEDQRAPLPTELTPEQAAAIKQFGDDIIESLVVSDRVRRERDAAIRRAQIRLVA